MELRLREISRTYRHIGRYQHILAVMVRHGFGEILERLRIEQYVELGLKVIGSSRGRVESLARGERIRLALEELGPTFIKIGQILSTRTDLIPLEVAAELEKLQDRAPAYSGGEARSIVAEELGAPVEEIFRAFNEEPMASASLGQVHEAILADSSRAVVKVQRPQIRRTIETDLEILMHLAGLAERHLEDLEVQRPREVVAEFSRVLEKELDYTIEAAHLSRFGRMFEDDEDVVIPKVYRELTTSRVLTLQRLEGTKVSDLEGLRRRGVDLELVARRGAEAMMEQIFLHGFFHADPHPGNVLVLDGGAVGFLDLGQTGRLDRQTRFKLAALLSALSQRDEEAAVQALLAMTDSDEPPDRPGLETDIAELLDWHLERAVGEMQMGRLLFRLVESLSRYQRRIPPDLFLVIKALGMVEGLARTLSPAFDLNACARPVLERLAVERMSPRRVAAESWESGTELLRVARQIPEGALEILNLLRRGRLRVEFEHRGLELVVRSNEKVANRLVYAIVLAALLVASSLVALGRFPPLWHGIPVIGLIGYVVAGILGLGLLISIWRSRRL